MTGLFSLRCTALLQIPKSCLRKILSRYHNPCRRRRRAYRETIAVVGAF